MVLGWFYKRAARNAAKAVQNDPQLRKELIDTLLSGNPSGATTQPSRTTPLPTDYVEEPGESEGGTGDLLLDSYRDLIDSAKAEGDPKKLAAWAERYDDRERFLIRSQQGRNARAARTEKEAAPAQPAATMQDIDLTDLAPHADEIATEVTDWLKTAGILPEQLVATAKSTISGTVRQHPDLISKGYQMFQGFVGKYAPGAKSQSNPGTPGSFDPQHPELWPQNMGYGGK